MGKNIENVCITEKLINKFQSQIMSNYGSFATSHCHQQNVHFTTFPVSSSFFFFQLPSEGNLPCTIYVNTTNSFPNKMEAFLASQIYP